MNIYQTAVWQDIPGFEGLYQASTSGQIRSLPRKRTRGKVLNGFIDRHGYHCMDLYDTIRYRRFVHRLVLLTFVGDSELEVNHKDGNPLNNALFNLEYATSSENKEHAYATGLQQTGPGTHGAKGSQNGNSKLAIEDIEEIRALKGTMSQTKIAILFGIGQTTVSSIHNHRTWIT